ncbi:hypothetical protein G6F57_022761 [Rhizopus arrhizus]|nr:hypothetical protein G6F57_022761 [Rhizopus arrhizus]
MRGDSTGRPVTGKPIPVKNPGFGVGTNCSIHEPNLADRTVLRRYCSAAYPMAESIQSRNACTRESAAAPAGCTR